MHIMLRKTLLLAAILIAIPLRAGRSDVAALPAGKLEVDVMTAAASPRATELSEKLRSTAQGDRDRWLADLRESQNGERLQWNERLGLTKEEHAELQRELGAMQFVKSGEAELEFVRASDGRILLRGDASLSELNGIVIDAENDAVQTPFGRTTERNVIIGGGDQRWSGVEWKLEKEGETFGTGTTIRFAIGQSLDDGRGILIYEAKHIADGQAPRREMRVLSFPMR
jgi:hypothetical protein